jgi:hypothetical protein
MAKAGGKRERAFAGSAPAGAPPPAAVAGMGPPDAGSSTGGSVGWAAGPVLGELEDEWGRVDVGVGGGVGLVGGGVGGAVGLMGGGVDWAGGTARADRPPVTVQDCTAGRGSARGASPPVGPSGVAVGSGEGLGV